jgi:hypothetical protein
MASSPGCYLFIFKSQPAAQLVAQVSKPAVSPISNRQSAFASERLEKRTGRRVGNLRWRLDILRAELVLYAHDSKNAGARLRRPRPAAALLNSPVILSVLPAAAGLRHSRAPFSKHALSAGSSQAEN